jgi:hypothetical protein
MAGPDGPPADLQQFLAVDWIIPAILDTNYKDSAAENSVLEHPEPTPGSHDHTRG